MSTLEKILLVGLGMVLAAMLLFSYHEFTETPGSDRSPSPDFEHSLGASLALGPFRTILSEQYSPELEQNCEALQSVIVATLHDVDQHLEELAVYRSSSFAVDKDTLALLCHTTASITLSDASGRKLILEKVPFSRHIPPGSSLNAVGTDVRINATVIMPGALPPSGPTTYGEELIPDRYLDASSSPL